MNVGAFYLKIIIDLSSNMSWVDFTVRPFSTCQNKQKRKNRNAQTEVFVSARLKTDAHAAKISLENRGEGSCGRPVFQHRQTVMGPRGPPPAGRREQSLMTHCWRRLDQVHSLTHTHGRKQKNTLLFLCNVASLNIPSSRTL